MTNAVTVKLKGKAVTLTQDAYLDGTHEAPHYKAAGVDTEGNVVVVKWEIYEHWLNEDGSLNDELEDETDACNWDKPVEYLTWNGTDVISITNKTYTLCEFLDFGMPYIESVIKQTADLRRDENGYVRNFDLQHQDDMRDAFRVKLIEIYDSSNEGITEEEAKDIVELTVDNMVNE